MYVPTTEASTLPEVETDSPPLEVAPASEYTEPFSTVAGFAPVIVIIGAVVSTTLTVLVTWIAALPAASEVNTLPAPCVPSVIFTEPIFLDCQNQNESYYTFLLPNFF